MASLQRSWRLLGWNPQSLGRRRYFDISAEIKNFHIAVFPGTSLRRFDQQGDCLHTHEFLHYSFGFMQNCNRSTGVSIFLNKFFFSDRNVIVAESPREKSIAGRCAFIRHKNKRDDFSVLAMYFPPKPTTAKDRMSYWNICHNMIKWANSCSQDLPNRCFQLVFSDVNDDIGAVKHSGEIQEVSSISVGNARRGTEKFIGTAFRRFCERHGLGICSTHFHTDSTYRGNSAHSYIDTWCIPISHISEVSVYRTMSRLGVKLQVGDQGDVKNAKLIDHVPIMLCLTRHFVHTPEQKRFRWDYEKLNVSLHDVSDPQRISFVNAVETELQERQQEWKSLWDETTIDMCWELLNGVMVRNARNHFEQTEHRDHMYVEIEQERDELRAQKNSLLSESSANKFFSASPSISNTN